MRISVLTLVLVALHANAAILSDSHRSWWSLNRTDYRRALRTNKLQPGMIFTDTTLDTRKSTVVFVHGANGSPSDFATLAQSIGRTMNVAGFTYDDKSRLGESAGLLRESIRTLPGRVAVVAHSMGGLLLSYVGTTASNNELRCVAGIYLNPLIGGSRHADATRMPRALKRIARDWVIQHLVRSSVQDLLPESDFEQAIFGRSSPVSGLAGRSMLLFTERRGHEPDIRPNRSPGIFGRSRPELLARLGGSFEPLTHLVRGHNAPLAHPEIVLPLITAALDRTAACDVNNVN